MAQALTAADRTPEPEDRVRQVGIGYPVVVERTRRAAFMIRYPSGAASYVSPTDDWEYVSRADGGPVTKDISPPEQEYALFTPRDPYDVD